MWRLAPGAKQPVLHRMTYPDRPHDAEALLLDASGRPLIVTKGGSGTVFLYAPATALRPDATTPLTALGQVTVPSTTTSNPFSFLGRGVITGAASAPDGRRVVLRSYADAFEYDVPDGDVVRALTTGTPRITPLAGRAPGRVDHLQPRRSVVAHRLRVRRSTSRHPLDDPALPGHGHHGHRRASTESVDPVSPTAVRPAAGEIGAGLRADLAAGPRRGNTAVPARVGRPAVVEAHRAPVSGPALRQDGGMPVLSTLRHPIVAAPMAGGPSTPALVAAVSAAGGLGFLAAGMIDTGRLVADVAEVRARTDWPFGVNLFLPDPGGVDEAAVRATPNGSPRRPHNAA